MDPLTVLPSEIVLRILEFASIGIIANLTRTARSWHTFIDDIHQDAIYAAHLPRASRSTTPNEYMGALKAFRPDSLSHGVSSWKEACRRRCLLQDAWDSPNPRPIATVIQIGSHPVWRFKPDFDRRLIVSTSQAGGVNVVDMDTGDLLWSLGRHEVRPFAHLEYQDGTAVWDRFGNSLEVWKTDLPDCVRGEFRRVALLPHDTETRGFQLSYDTLCVVSTEGEGFVYDVPTARPEAPVTLRTHLRIANGAIGHLYQCQKAVVYSMGSEGYHFHDKISGELLGVLQPRSASQVQVYHIAHPVTFASDASNIVDIIGGFGGILSTQTGLPFGPQNNAERLTPMAVGQGPLTCELRRADPEAEAQHLIPPIDEDEWGAGMLNGNTMAGVSRGGRLLVCWDWQRALSHPQDLSSFTAVIECEPSGDRSFDLGGWLSIHETVGGKRVLFEVKERIYMLSLGEDGRFELGRPAFAVAQSIAPQITVPVSFMAIYDDCIMSTFTTLGMELEEDGDGDGPEEQLDPPRRERYFPTKAVRVLCLAPDVDGDASDNTDV
ncbi:hypothetical protein J7T55_010747 [Diaporthe amygdali]|uniref:uncharacterized protein n=1 Tax=Phomopsis amygdali TaxID=1214568 RepID=UPI0022FDF79E|nr:uncharacterized protein J7T55_010747 [Diaporthe amygdali]KAJ0114358.1 hypothetical protein J7T55_010747 [Diaporthe amygdali]